MKINKLFFINLYKKILSDRLILLLVILGVISLTASIILLSGEGDENVIDRRTPSSNRVGDSSDVSPTKSPFNLFGLLNNSASEDDKKNETQANKQALTNISNGNPSASVPSYITLVNSGGSVTTQPLSSSGVTSTLQGSINPNSSIQQGVDSSSDDNIAIKFEVPNGGSFTYIPPGTPNAEIKWGRYKNEVYNYALNYPINWQQEFAIDNEGHELLTLYPPGVDTNNPNSPFIAFAFSSLFDIVGTHLEDGFATSIVVDGQKGNLYTDGEIGFSYITSFINYLDGSFGLTASKSDETFAYIYYYMINSIDFNTK